MAMTAANLRTARARLEETLGAEHAAAWSDDQVAMWAANSTDLAQELERRSWADHIAHAERLGRARRQRGRLEHRYSAQLRLTQDKGRMRPGHRSRATAGTLTQRRKTAASTSSGSSDPDPAGEPEPAACTIGAATGALADTFITAALGALAEVPRAELTLEVPADLPRHGLVAALVLVDGDLRERGVTWRWAPNLTTDRHLEVLAYIERTPHELEPER